MLIDTKGVQVVLSKNNCLDKEAMPEKSMLYATGWGKVRMMGHKSKFKKIIGNQT